MWPPLEILADGPNAGIQQYLIPALAAVLAAALALVGSTWGTFRTTSVNRETEFNKRVDAEVDQLREERDRARAELGLMTVDRDKYRELWSQLRLDVRAAGLNPDSIGKGPTP